MLQEGGTLLKSSNSAYLVVTFLAWCTLGCGKVLRHVSPPPFFFFSFSWIGRENKGLTSPNWGWGQSRGTASLL